VEKVMRNKKHNFIIDTEKLVVEDSVKSVVGFLNEK